jgi:ABC-type uncharacterized transport system ATPase subunit
MTAVPALRAEGLGKRFASTVAVDDLTLTVPPGEVFGFLGPNGAEVHHDQDAARVAAADGWSNLDLR